MSATDQKMSCLDVALCDSLAAVLNTESLLRLESVWHMDPPLTYLLWPAKFAALVEERVAWTYSAGPVRRLSYMHMLAHESVDIQQPIVERLSGLTGRSVYDLNNVLRVCLQLRPIVHAMGASDLLASMADDSYQFLVALFNPDFAPMDLWDLLEKVDLQELREAICAL